jgi:hypothetical protein
MLTRSILVLVAGLLVAIAFGSPAVSSETAQPLFARPRSPCS